MRAPSPVAARPFIDAHLDLAYLALTGRDLTQPLAEGDGGCVTLPALAEASIGLALATIFTAAGETGPDGYPHHLDRDAAWRCGMNQWEVYSKLDAAGAIRVVRCQSDLPREAEDSDTLPIVILMENADPMRDVSDAARWHARGLRAVGLAWSTGSRYAGGNAAPGGVTSEGRDLIRELDALGIIHDLSHLSDQAFDDLLAVARGPVMASHSNARALLSPIERHLRDDQIRAIDARRGVIGLNLFGRFLAREGRATIDDCVRQLDHMAQVVGHRRLSGLGSDMDGGFGHAELPEHLDHPRHLPRLLDALRDDGWSDEEIDGFRWKNWHAFLSRSLPAQPA